MQFKVPVHSSQEKHSSLEHSFSQHRATNISSDLALLSKSPFLQQVFTPADHSRSFTLSVSCRGPCLFSGSCCKQLETLALAFFLILYMESAL